ncbi:MAG: DUF1572 domain-containing protein [Lewinellaceae bacterium]|nr:DUF1572 domain-containing protein [Lewinellaceae bacterium]
MEPNQQIAHRLREVILNGRWIANTNFQDQLSDLGWEEAVKKIGSLNTIAALTFHIHYYISGILNVLKGGTLDIRDKYSFDMPPIESQQDWENLKDRLWSDTEAFAAIVEQMPAGKLNDAFVDEKYGTWQRNIDAMIEHSYYHLGQVTLIKKLIRQTYVS